MNNVILRDIKSSVLPVFFEYQKDDIANHMAAFTSKDPSNWDQFYQHWNRILSDETIIKQAITFKNAQKR